MAQQPHFSISVVTPPARDPVDVPYVKAWLRIDDDSLDQHLSDMITAARGMIEDYAGRAFLPTTFLQQMDRFPLVPNSQYTPGNPSALSPILQNTWPLDPSIWAIKLARSPLLSVVSVQYLAVDGTLQTLDPSQYVVDAASEPARLQPASGSYWPASQWVENSVRVTFTAGYGTSPLNVPQKWKRAIVATVGWWYDHPSGPADDLPPSVKAIIDQDPVTEMW